MALDPSQPNAQFGYEPEAEHEPDSMPKEGMTLPYDSIDIAMDGWTYRIWRGWLGQSEEDQRKNAYLFTDILQQYDPSATGLLEAAKSHPESPDPYSWVFRFGLFGDPSKVTEAIEKIDGQLLKMAENWKVVPGSAKALVTRTDGSEEAIELPPDMIAADLSTSAYRLLDLVQTGGVEAEPTTESSVSELRQISSPDSEEYCSRHKKTGSEHTQDEIEDDLLNVKGEDERGESGAARNLERQIEEIEQELSHGRGTPWTPGYQAVPKALKEGEVETETKAPIDWGRIKKDVGNYGEELVGLIDTLLKLGEDPTVTPEAIEKSSKVAQNRVKDIVKWGSDTTDRVYEEETLGPEADDIVDGLQKILEHGSRIQMLLIGTEEEAKQTAKTPLPEPELEPEMEPELPPPNQPLREPETESL